MAEQKKSDAQTIQEAAGTVKQAAKLAVDVGRVFAGDVTAIKDVLMNQTFWKIMICFIVIISMIGMLLGGWLAAVIEFIKQAWAMNWAENWEDEGIKSNGDLAYLQTEGWIKCALNTVADTASALWNAAKSLFSGDINDAKDSGRDNGELDGGYEITEEDYQTTLEAVTNEASLSQAVIDRINMIKGRVNQRRIQIIREIYNQYTSEEASSAGLGDIQKELKDRMDESLPDEPNADDVYIIYAGHNDSIEYNIDTSALDLTDLQALKILALFSIQNDCQMGEVDMWALMDYCGWFNSRDKDAVAPLFSTSDSIYNSVAGKGYISAELREVTDILTTFELDPLVVPVWNGTCSAQWYLEQKAQIKEANETGKAHLDSDGELDNLFEEDPIRDYTLSGENVIFHERTVICDYRETIETGIELIEYHIEYWIGYYYNGNFISERKRPSEAGETLYWSNLKEGVTYEVRQVMMQTWYYSDAYGGETWTGEKSHNVIDTFTTTYTSVEEDSFMKMSQYQSFSIIDCLFYMSECNAILTRTEYDSNQSWSQEEIDALGSEKLSAWWSQYVCGKYFVDAGIYIKRDQDCVVTCDLDTLYISNLTVPTTTTTVNADNSRHIVETSSVFVIYKCKRDENGNVVKDDNGVVYEYYGEQQYSIDKAYVTVNNGNGQKTLWFSVVLGTEGKDIDENDMFKIYHAVKTETKIYDANGKFITSYSAYAQDTDPCSGSRPVSCRYMSERLNTLAYQTKLQINVTFEAISVDDIAYRLIGLWPGSLENTTTIVRFTENMNRVGKTESDEYSLCLSKGVLSLYMYSGSKLSVADGTSTNLRRSYSTVSQSGNQMTTTKWIYEYGISKKELASTNSKPDSGWHQVDKDGDSLVFEMESGQTHYYVWQKVTRIIEIVDMTNGSSSKSTSISLYKMDYLDGAGHCFMLDSDYKEYPSGELGNELLRKKWTDNCTMPDGTIKTFYFERKQASQYETYIDLVMSFCELMGIPYDDWDEAIKRAQELKVEKMTAGITDNGNKIAKTTDGEYYLYLSGGLQDLYTPSNSKLGLPEIAVKLKASTSDTSVSGSTKVTTKWKYEYGIANGLIVGTISSPSSGWRTASQNGEVLSFSINYSSNGYYAFQRVTKTVITEHMTTGVVMSETKEVAVYILDYISVDKLKEVMKKE